MAKEALGIPNFGPHYLNVLPGQIDIVELIKTVGFVTSFVENGDIKEFIGDHVDVRFINYGSTQLVFVVEVDDRKYTLLVNQPATSYGVGKKEYDNLTELSKVNPDLVVRPIHYHEDGERELYMTPYYYQSRCIGVEYNDWGVWKPEPEYHFSNFNDKERLIINSSMVASLIKLYNGKGLSKVRLDGGDFTLLKCYDKLDLSYDNVLNSIRLIAARDMVDISLDDYIELLKNELLNSGINEYTILGKKPRQLITEKEIDSGIELGMKLRKKYN